MAKLILKLNDSVLKEIALDRPKLTIGRKTDNDVVIEDAAVSGHHARISQVQAVYFIEDLGSTNGTSVNERRIDRKQLRADDRIGVGKHVLVFRDDVKVSAPAVSPRPFDSERTMVLDAKTQRDLLKGATAAGAATAAKGRVGVLQVLDGRTDKKEYLLTGRLSVIGSSGTATVRLTSWFAPKTAAMINRGNEAYSVSMTDEGKQILLNGAPVDGRADLKDGDLLEVAGVKLCFLMRDEG